LRTTEEAKMTVLPPVRETKLESSPPRPDHEAAGWQQQMEDLLSTLVLVREMLRGQSP
jgi:hypothetical protein